MCSLDASDPEVGARAGVGGEALGGAAAFVSVGASVCVVPTDSATAVVAVLVTGVVPAGVVGAAETVDAAVDGASEADVVDGELMDGGFVGAGWTGACVVATGWEKPGITGGSTLLQRSRPNTNTPPTTTTTAIASHISLDPPLRAGSRCFVRLSLRLLRRSAAGLVATG